MKSYSWMLLYEFNLKLIIIISLVICPWFLMVKQVMSHWAHTEMLSIPNIKISSPSLFWAERKFYNNYWLIYHKFFIIFLKLWNLYKFRSLKLKHWITLINNDNCISSMQFDLCLPHDVDKTVYLVTFNIWLGNCWVFFLRHLTRALSAGSTKKADFVYVIIKST